MKRAVLTVIALILLGGDSMITGQEETSVLSGVIDFHTHSGPDSRPRSVNDIEAADKLWRQACVVWCLKIILR